MNVGHVCKQIPAYLPHELLGFKKDDLNGMMLTFKIVEEMNRQETEEYNKKKSESSGRRSKFEHGK